jgi:peptidyl-prolyl cis-trans isomerase A (cyclophilin A)
MRGSIVRAVALAAVACLCSCLLYASEVASPLLNPEDPAVNRTAPPTFKTKFETSKGDFVVQVTREWAPMGADRFFNLVRHGFFDDARFFRVISGFMAQFGINGDPKVSAAWRTQRIKDDPVKQSNTRGFVSFATSGPNSRTTQLFINYGDNSRLDKMGFAPFGRVIEGMEVVEQLYSGYGEGAPQGKGPNQARIQQEGNDYLNREFPRLDYIKKATIIE